MIGIIPMDVDRAIIDLLLSDLVEEICYWRLLAAGDAQQGVVFPMNMECIIDASSLDNATVIGAPIVIPVWFWTILAPDMKEWRRVAHGPYTNPLDATADMILTLQRLSE